MREIDEEVNQLIQAVRESKTYREYDKQRTHIKENPELKERIDAFRAENYRLQNEEGEDHFEEKMDALLERYGAFLEEPEVSAFLDAELSLCRMMQELNARIIGSLNFE